MSRRFLAARPMINGTRDPFTRMVSEASWCSFLPPSSPSSNLYTAALPISSIVVTQGRCTIYPSGTTFSPNLSSRSVALRLTKWDLRGNEVFSEFCRRKVPSVLSITALASAVIPARLQYCASLMPRNLNRAGDARPKILTLSGSQAGSRNGSSSLPGLGRVGCISLR